MVNTHLSIVPQQGKGKQRRHRTQPKDDIQREGQHTQADIAPHRPHPVVDKAQHRPKQEALPKNRRLACDVNVHTQRSRREKKPPRLPPPSSS